MAKGKRRVSAKQRAAARRNIKKAHAARKCRTKLKHIRKRKSRRNPIAAAAAETKRGHRKGRRKSAKRVRAGKKAARTRKRRHGGGKRRGGARKSSKRSRAAKKAARTRARNKAHRRAAARRGARKSHATRAYKRTSRVSKREKDELDRGGYGYETRRRRKRRKARRRRKNPIAASAAMTPRRRRRRTHRRSRRNPVRRHRHHARRRRNPIGNPLVGGHVANPISGPMEFVAGFLGVGFGFGLASLGDRLVVTHALNAANQDAPAQGQIYNSESPATPLWSNFSTLGWKRMAMAFGAVVLPLGAAHVVRKHMGLKSFFQLAGFGALGRTAGKMMDDGVAALATSNATAQRLYAAEIAATAKMNAANLAALPPAPPATFAGVPGAPQQPQTRPAAPPPMQFAPPAPPAPPQRQEGYVQPNVPASTSVRLPPDRVNFHLMNPDNRE